MNVEIWKRIPGFKYYEASNLGRIRSSYPGKLTGDKKPKRIMHPANGKDGYKMVCLTIAKKTTKSVSVHRAVITAFSGPRPHNKEIAHIDGNKLNNAISNLKYVTKLENEQHKIIHGNSLRGSKNSKSKLSEEDVVLIFYKLKAGIKQKKLAREYKISESTIASINGGRNWGWLTSRLDASMHSRYIGTISCDSDL